MEKRLLECGHRQPVKDGAGATWCPIDNELVLVVDEPETVPVQRGTAEAIALARR